MAASLRKTQQDTNSRPGTKASLDDLRNVVRALEGRAPTLLAEASERYQPLTEPGQLNNANGISVNQSQSQSQAHLARLGFDVDAVDSGLMGGLVSDALHEIFPKKTEWDDGLTTAFALSLLSRLQASDLGHSITSATGTRTPRPIVWITQKDTAGATLSPQGLMALGFNPDALFQIEARNDADALWAFEEILNHDELGAAVVEVCNLDLAQSHRIQLKAQETQSRGRFRLLMMLRRNKGARQPQVQPTSAATRWRLGPVPPQKVAVAGPDVGANASANASAGAGDDAGAGMRDDRSQVPVPASVSMLPTAPLTPSATMPARGHSTNHVSQKAAQDRITPLVPRMVSSPLSRVRWSAELFRQRGGAPANWLLEWSYTRQCFQQLIQREDG